MSGVAIIGELLRGHAPLLALVPAERIRAGMLPDKVTMPTLLVRHIGGTERQTLVREEIVRTTERVAVTVRAANYREQRAVIAHARTACAGFVGDIAGLERVSVLNAGTGPDVIGPAGSFEGTIDFRVSFDGPA